MTETTAPDAAPGATAEGRCGCPDFSTSRRRFLAGVAAGTGTLAAGTLFGDAFC